MKTKSSCKTSFIVRLVPIFVTVIFLGAGTGVLVRGQDSCTTNTRPIIEQTVDAQYLWSTCAGLSTGAIGVLVHQNNLIVADFFKATLVDYVPQSGNELWTTPVRGTSNLVLDVPRKRVYTNVIYGSLRDIYAWDLTSGQVVWVNNVNDGSRTNYYPILLANGQLIAVGDSPTDVYQIDANTGNFGNKIAVVSLFIFPDGYAWQFDKGYLKALDALSGESIWQSSEQVLSKDCTCVKDIQVNANVVLAEFGSTLMAFDDKTHIGLWAKSMDDMVGHAALTKDFVYVLDLKATLHIFAVQSGLEVGHVAFKPADVGHDSYLLDSESISSSQIVATDDNLVAIAFGDTDVLSVYRIAVAK